MDQNTQTIGIPHLLEDPRIRRIQARNQARYCAIDVVKALTDADDAAHQWNDLKGSVLKFLAKPVTAQLDGEELDFLPLSGVLRLAGAIDSPRARRLFTWLADAAGRHIEESQDPELVVRHLRQSYADKGRSRAWIDQRLRCISSRNELVHEWHERGIADGEQFRALTNQLTEAAFGMDVNSFLQSKGTDRNLRDHLSDLELALISLAESTAASLHRQRQSKGMDQLHRDIEDVGRIISQTRQQIEQTGLSPATQSTGPSNPIAA